MMRRTLPSAAGRLVKMEISEGHGLQRLGRGLQLLQWSWVCQRFETSARPGPAGNVDGFANRPTRPGWMAIDLHQGSRSTRAWPQQNDRNHGPDDKSEREHL